MFIWFFIDPHEDLCCLDSCTYMITVQFMDDSSTNWATVWQMHKHEFTVNFTLLLHHILDFKYIFLFLCVKYLLPDFIRFSPCFYFESNIRKAHQFYYKQPVISRFILLPTIRTTEPVDGSPLSTHTMHRLSFVFLAAFEASVVGLSRVDASPVAGPCVAPLQWEGRWVLYDHSTGRNHRAAVSYDGLNQRIRILQQHKKHTPCQK